jgi:putative thioredoxin
MDVSASTFQRDVVERSRAAPVVVDFWAPWCGPCRQLGPVLEKLAAEAGGGWTLAKINTDDNQSLAAHFGISGIPAVKAFVDGKVVDEFVGARPEAQVRAWLARFVPDRAALLAAKGEFEAALAEDPAQPDALLALAARAVAEGDADRARALAARIRPADRSRHAPALARLQFALEAPPLAEARAAFSADPGDPAARHSVGLALAASGAWPDALDAFLSLVRTDRSWGQDAGRKSMLAVFDALGPRHPLVDDYRRRLSMELYK